MKGGESFEIVEEGHLNWPGQFKLSSRGAYRKLEILFPLLPYNACVDIIFSAGRGQLKCDGTRTETRFRLSTKRTSPFKSAGGRQFSRLLAAEVCASAVVMLDTPCSEVVWRVLATHSIRQFPLHFPSLASPCTITFQLESTSECTARRISRGSIQESGVGWDQCHLPVLSAIKCLLTAYRWSALHLNRGPLVHERFGAIQGTQAVCTVKVTVTFTVHTARVPAPHNSHHNQCRTPYATVHTLVLLMMLLFEQ